MAGVNRVTLVGNLGADPEIKRTQDGRPIVNLRVATSESWRDKQSGERREKTEWHRVVVFNEGLAKVCEQYMQKGTTVYVEGKLRTREWEDQQGQKRYATEVVLEAFGGTLLILKGGMGREGSGDDFGGGGDRGGGSGGGRGASSNRSSGGGGGRSGGGGGYRPGGDLDDEIQF